MSDDWKPGDLAWCVRGGCSFGRLQADWHENHSSMILRAGAIYTVARVGREVGDGLRGLSVTAEPETPWLVSRFRKIKPLTDKERDEFVVDLLTGKPAKEDA